MLLNQKWERLWSSMFLISQLTTRRSIRCKKRVWFKSPIISTVFETKRTSVSKLAVFDAGESVQMFSPVEQMKPDTDLSKEGEMNSKEALQLMVRMKKPSTNKPKRAKFFDFIDDSDRDKFFHRMQERCDKLRNTPLFPLTAAGMKKCLSYDIWSQNNICKFDLGWHITL